MDPFYEFSLALNSHDKPNLAVSCFHLPIGNDKLEPEI
jgi:hypothetical protein